MEHNSISPIKSSNGEFVPPRPEGKSINDVLFPELIQKILGYLSLSEDKAAGVCRVWNSVVTKFPEPSLKIFGKKAWQEYYNFDIEGEVPPLPKKIGQITRSLRRRLKGEKEAPTCSLLLMPKGLSLNILKDLVQKPIKGNRAQFIIIDRSPTYFEELGDQALKKSYWVLITNDLIDGGWALCYADKEKLIKEKAGPNNWRGPTHLEAEVCVIMNYVSSEKDKTLELYKKHKYSFTQCQEQTNYRDSLYHYVVQMAVQPEDLEGSDLGSLFVFNASHLQGVIGVAVCRKFC